MENPLEQQMRESSQGGSSSSIGAQFEQKGAGVIKTTTKDKGFAGVKETFGHLVTETMKNIDNVRGGRGSTGNPAEIKASIANARKVETHVAHDLAKLRNDKEALLFIIADLKIKEKQVMESGRRGKAEALRRKIAGEQKRVDAINGVLPERNLAEDQKKVQGIVTEWHEGKRDWTKELAQYAKAEKSLKKNPSDGHTQGEANRARTEKVATEELLSKVGHEAEQIVAGSEPHPAQDDSIGNIRTEGSALMREVQPEADPEELIRIEPAGTGSLELPKEEQGGGIEQGARTVEDTQINTTAEALTKQIEGESTQATANDWQAEAVKNWEEASGKKVPDLELEHTPEEHDAILPILTEVMDETVGVPQEWQKREETPEERKERILNVIYKKSEDVPERGKKAGMSEKMLDILHAGGETYRALPLKTKLLVSVTLFGIAWTAGGTIASVAIGGSLFQRALGGLATFVGIEGSLKASAEKSGHERGEWEKRRHTAEALIAGFIVGEGVLGHAIQNVFSEIMPSHSIIEATHAEPSELEQGQANLAATEHLNATNVPVEGGAAAEAINLNQFVQTAEVGDSRWSLVERALEKGPYKDLFNSVHSDEQRTYIIDALKDKLTAGMTEEQANTLNVGDKIDFQGIFVEREFMDKVFSDAQNLSPEEMTNIQNYNVEIPAETAARAVSAGELFNQPLITDFAPPEQPGTAIPAEAGKLMDNLISTYTDIPAPEQVATTPSAVSAETVGLVSLSTAATMPQEFAPKNPQILAYIDQQFHDDIHALFGKEGIMGFGRVDGVKSPHWLDFENRTFDEIKNATPAGGAGSVGINNPEAHKKMQSYLVNVSRESKIQPEEREPVGKYIKRAMEITASRLQTKQ